MPQEPITQRNWLDASRADGERPVLSDRLLGRRRSWTEMGQAAIAIGVPTPPLPQ